MNIWVVNEGEPLPMLTGKGRLMRGGMLADYFSCASNEVVWWFSTFLHYQKEYYCYSDKVIKLKTNLELRLLHVKKAYKSNISIARIKYCKDLAKKFLTAIKDIPENKKPDIIYCSWPLIELADVCVKYGKENNIPVVIDIRDFWPDIFIQPLPKVLKPIGILGIALLYGKKTKFVMRNATMVSGVIPKAMNFAVQYGRQLSPYDHPVYLAYKKKPLSERSVVFLKELGIKKGDFVVVYYGSITLRISQLDIIKQAAFKLQHTNVKFVICGSGPDLDALKQNTSSNIFFCGYRNAAEISEVSSVAKLGLLPYKNTTDFIDSLPNKIGEYLAEGIPVLTSLTGLSKSVLEENECGSYFSDVETLCNVIDSYFDNSKLEKQKRNAFKVYNSLFNADIVYPAFEKDLEKIVFDRSLK